MRIESARPEDYDAICAVIAEGDAAHREQLPDVFCEKSGPIRPRDFLVQRMQRPESTILVALEDADIVGVLEVVMKAPQSRDGHVARRVALIDNVVVRADHRGRGLGSMLIARAESWAIEQGATAIELNVWATNTSAKRLYESLGYVTRLVRMERSLEGNPSTE
jgi:ribosomal protein S18 acetylase RimI-like enzyme